MKILRPTILIVALSLSGCGDPYQTKIPSYLIITDEDAKKIADSIKTEDAEIFKRWRIRIARNENIEYGIKPQTVKDAIENQKKFEAKKEADEKQQRIADEENKRKQEKIIETQKALAQNALSVDGEIKKLIAIRGVTYNLKPIFGKNGWQIDTSVNFNLKVENYSSKNLIGLKGYLSVSDIFGRKLSAYPFQLESELASSTWKIITISGNYNNGDLAHNAMSAGQRLNLDWFFDSAVFSDGTRIDIQTVSEVRGAGKRL